MSVYVDGVLSAAGKGSTGPRWATLFDLQHIGISLDNGVVDDFRLYNYMLSTSEITALYDLQPPPAPATPTGLGATAGNTQVLLSWNSPNGATGSILERALAQSGPYTVIASNLFAVSYLDTNLMNGTSYYYEVAAMNSGGASSTSLPVTATPQAPMVPACPSNLTASLVTTNLVNLAWVDNSGGTASFQIYRSYDGVNFYLDGSAGAGVTSYSDANMVSGLVYYYYVVAVSGGVSSAPTSTLMVTMLQIPTGITTLSGNGEIYLSWQATAGAVNYNVMRSTTGGQETTIANVVTAGYFDTNVMNGSTYYYIVSAVSGGGQSVDSSEVSAIPGTLTIPSGIVGYWQFNDPISLGGDSSGMGNTLTTASGTPVYSSAGKFSGALYLNGSSTMAMPLDQFPNGVPANANSYTIAVWEKAASGCPNNGGFMGWGNDSPDECNNLRLNGPNSADDYWFANDFAVSGLSVNPMDGNWHAIAVTWNGTTQTMYVDGAKVGTRTPTQPTVEGNNFIVGKTTADVNFEGWMENLLIANRALTPTEITNYQAGFVNTDPGVPAVPTGLTAMVENGQILLNWVQTAGAVSYNLYRSTDGVSYVFLNNVVGIRMVDGTAVNGQANYYEVAAVDGYGPSANSVAVGVYLPLPRLEMSVSNGALSITWPSWVSGWTLYSTTNLTPPMVWQPVTNVPVNINGTYNVSLPIGLGSQFFELSNQ